MEWTLVFEGWEPAEERRREALCALANGVIATRGAAEERGLEEPSYPGTYIAGCYDRLVSEVADRSVTHTDLVRWPSWTTLAFRPEGGEWLDPSRLEVLEYRQTLDLRAGRLERRLRLRDSAGRTTRLESERIVSMADPSLAALRWSVTAEDWDGSAEVHAAIDGDVENRLVARDRPFRGRHVRVLHACSDGETAELVAESIESRIRVAMVARTRAHGASTDRITMEDVSTATSAAQRMRVTMQAGRTVTVEKVVAIHSSRDPAIGEPVSAARRHAARAPSYDALATEHERAWRRLWDRCDVRIEGDELAPTQAALRLHVFHLLQTASHHLEAHDVGLPARGLSEGYRGHVFWDELFVFPFLTLSVPEIARSLLLYRYRRLREARAAAAEAGLEGAMYPWRSATDGREETLPVILNPYSERWMIDRTCLQRHVSAAVAYNVWRYYEATHDYELLSFYGAEIILEVARLFASMTQWDEQLGRYRIAGVVGPDEYHTLDPRTGEAGLRDNAYTNVMAAWSMRCACRVVEELHDRRRRELFDELGIDEDDVERWDRTARRIYVPHLDTGVIEQLEGWNELEELDWGRLVQEHGDIHRLDWLLEARGEDVNRYKASKQGDVLMLFYLFPLPELQQLLDDAGYALGVDDVRRTVAYYRNRTSHGSTLSMVVHSWVLARLDRGRSWDQYSDSLRTDLDDVKRGTTEQGLHLGALAGTVDLMQRCYAGVEPRRDALWLRPHVPETVRSIAFSVRYRGHWVHLDVRQAGTRVSVEEAEPDPRVPVRIGFAGEIHELHQGESLWLERGNGAEKT